MWCLLGDDNEAKTNTYAKKGGSDEIVLLGRLPKEDIFHIVDMIDTEDNDG